MSKPRAIRDILDENRRLRDGLTAIYQAARGDEKSEWWSARKYLDDHGIYNDDLSSLDRLVEAICASLLQEQ